MYSTHKLQNNINYLLTYLLFIYSLNIQLYQYNYSTVTKIIKNEKRVTLMKTFLQLMQFIQ